jgi:hypothetical protein
MLAVETPILDVAAIKKVSTLLVELIVLGVNRVPAKH